jgi:hypothetical protein
MPQPVSGFQKTYISGGVGTAVIKNTDCYFKRLVIAGTYVGTVQFDDASSTTGTSATSPIITLVNPATSLYRHIDLDIQCKNGLVYQATGTPVITVVWN